MTGNSDAANHAESGPKTVVGEIGLVMLTFRSPTSCSKAMGLLPPSDE
jgi:hypothetical protein